MAAGPRIRRVYIYSFFGLTLCAVIVGFIILLNNYQYIDKIQPHSYYGLFLVAFLTTAPVPVFIPISVIVFMLGTLLNPLLIGIICGLGNTAGNCLTYLAGHAGTRFLSSFFRSVFPEDQPSGRLKRIFDKLKISRLYRLAQQRRLLALFILSFVPNPLLTPMVISLGSARVTAWKVIFISWTGQTLQAIILAYLGHLGLRAILDVFGVFS